MAAVYLITNNRDKTYYIGSSRQPEVRFKAHLGLLRKGQHPLKCGPEDVTFSILEEVPWEKNHGYGKLNRMGQVLWRREMDWRMAFVYARVGTVCHNVK